jgi:ABC-2 type transport system permease protein
MITNMPFAIETQYLTKRYFKQTGWRNVFSRHLDKPAVNGVTLQIKQEELFGLVGPNGAGKTTLIKMLATLVVPTSGVATVNGFSLDQELDIKRSVGLVTSDERSFYWRLTGQENLEFFAAMHGLNTKEAKSRCQEVIELVGLKDQIDKPFQKYSTGMKQRLSIARALIVYPKILFLDEPTKGLDPDATRDLHILIKEQLTRVSGITVLLTSHNLAEVQRLCDRVAIMSQGQIRACGNLNELSEIINTEDQYKIHIRGWNSKLNNTILDQKIDIQISQIKEGDKTLLNIQPGDTEDLNQVIDIIRREGGLIEKLSHQPISLEKIFSHITKDLPNNEPINIGSAAQPQGYWLNLLGFFNDLVPGSIKHFHRVAIATLRRDIHSEVSYRFSFVLQFLTIFFSVAVFYFVAILLGDSINPYLEPYGGDYFAFVLIGIAFGSYFGISLSSFSRSLRSAQVTGTLEAMLSTPTRISTIILSSSQWNYLMTTLRVVVYLLIGTLFLDVNMGEANYLAAFIILVLTIISFSSLGIMAAGFIMVLKRGDPVTWVFGTVANLLGGIYYPITVLPGWMQTLAAWIPVTYALRAMRLALLQGASFSELQGDMLALLLFCLVLLPLSLVIFGLAVRLARIDGSLTHY